MTIQVLDVIVQGPYQGLQEPVHGELLVKMERPTTESQLRGLRCEEVNSAAQRRIRKNWSHMSKIRFVGLDVHAETIAVAEPVARFAV